MRDAFFKVFIRGNSFFYFIMSFIKSIPSSTLTACHIYNITKETSCSYIPDNYKRHN